MAELKGTRTEALLQRAFAVASQAVVRYRFFAQQADVEGRPDLAAAFRSAADTRAGHAFGILEFLIDVGDPATGLPADSAVASLESAVESESAHQLRLSPEGAAMARSEGLTEIAEWLESLARAEATLAARMAQSLDGN